ncbi:hypothetical protein SORBI_3009G128200 [Sorghum bicolor]|uniref:Uncharacterized protein n=1 Tax=Sorghum bicolor TaxID=4558 RepID=A0A1B6P8U7_SORBI|nr:hypothetical protein SORBI_3009G128200 [Sorghum bicolor]
MSTSLRLQSCTPRLFFFSRKDQPVDSLVVINRFLGHATEATASPRVLGFSMRACAPRPRARVLGFSIRACNAALCVRPDTRMYEIFVGMSLGWQNSAAINLVDGRLQPVIFTLRSVAKLLAVVDAPRCQDQIIRL